MFRSSRFLHLVESLAVLACSPAFMQAQYRQEPGRSLGTVTTQGNLPSEKSGFVPISI
jgi:hypothetical protein